MKLGLVGCEIGYSLSPIIHQHGAELLGLACIYDLHEVASSDQLRAFLTMFAQAGGRGLNITKPYKYDILPLIDVSPGCCSVNTLVATPNGSWRGVSTDGIGFEQAVERMGASLLSFSQIVFMGNGGVVGALLEHLSAGVVATRLPEVVICRRSDRMDAISAQIYPRQIQFEDFSPAALTRVLDASPSSTLLVQASAAPLAGDDLARFCPSLAGFAGMVCDLVYGVPSRLVVTARELGLVADDGLTMLIEQARQSQILWWGEAAPHDELRAACLAKIGRKP